MEEKLLIGVVGPCASGKTTLIESLTKHGFQARQIAQEHSFVQEMWQRVTDPDLLIFLDVSFKESIRRRPQNYDECDHQEQHDRLRHARQNADFYLHTDHKSIAEVRNQVVRFLAKYK